MKVKMNGNDWLENSTIVNDVLEKRGLSSIMGGSYTYPNYCHTTYVNKPYYPPIERKMC